MFSEEIKNAEQRGEDEGARLEELFMEVQQNEEEFKNNDPVFASAIAARNNVNVYCNKFMAEGLSSILFICGGPAIYMGPYLRGASFNEAFAPDGPLRNMVSYDDYVPCTAFPRHIDKKKRAEVVAQFEMDFPDYQMHPAIKSSLGLDWYLYGPIFDGGGCKSPSTISKMQTIELQIAKWKRDFHGKVCSSSRTSEFYAGKVINIIVNEFGFQKRGEPDTILRIMSKIYTNTPKSEYGSTPQKSPVVDLTGKSSAVAYNSKFSSSSSDVHDAIISSSSTDGGAFGKAKRSLTSGGSHGSRKSSKSNRYE